MKSKVFRNPTYECRDAPHGSFGLDAFFQQLCHGLDAGSVEVGAIRIEGRASTYSDPKLNTCRVPGRAEDIGCNFISLRCRCRDDLADQRAWLPLKHSGEEGVMRGCRDSKLELQRPDLKP